MNTDTASEYGVTLLAASAQGAGAEGAKEPTAAGWGEAIGNFLHHLFFEKWTSDVFQRSSWEDLMYGFWVVLALTGALMLIGELVARRAGYPPGKRTVKWTCVTLTVIGFVSYFSFFNPNVRYVNYYHRHEFFHYYLGAKYSRELGYKRLYECVAVAEVELGHGAELRKQRLRDLGSKNLTKPISDTTVFKDPAHCTQHFATARWQQFKDDVKWLRTTAKGSYWENMKKDHGYNPPPVWTTTGKLFSMLGPASDTTFKWLASIDVLLHIGILALFRWGFGWRVAALAAVFWGCNAAGNFYWTGGAFLRQDWIFFLVASVCLAKKKYFGLSGAAFIWTGLLRAFPLAAGFGWAAMIALHWLRHRRLHPSHKRFLAGCAIAAGVLIPTSMAVAGPSSYKDFIAHIALHNRTPLTNHMGMETMFVHDWDGRMRFSRDDRESDPFKFWKEGRLERKAKWRPVIVVVWLLLAGWTVWALRKTKHFWLGLPLSLPLLGSLTSITCYYFAMFIAFAPLVRLRPSLGPAMLATAAASQVLLAHSHWIDDRFTALSWLFFAFSLLPLAAFSRPLSRSAIRTWWRSLSPRAKTPKQEPEASPS